MLRCSMTPNATPVKHGSTPGESHKEFVESFWIGMCLMCCRLGLREEGGMDGFRACFAGLEDPRSGNAQRHELDEIVMIALMAVLCGAESCVDMALFGRSKESLLRRFL